MCQAQKTLLTFILNDQMKYTIITVVQSVDLPQVVLSQEKKETERKACDLDSKCEY